MNGVSIATRASVPSLAAVPTRELSPPVRSESRGPAGKASVSATVQARYQMSATRREEAVFAYRIKIGDWVGFGYAPADASDSRSFEERVGEVLRMANEMQRNTRRPGSDSVEIEIWTADAENPIQIVGQSVASGALSLQVDGPAAAVADRLAQLLPSFLARAEPSVLTLGWTAADTWPGRQMKWRDSFRRDVLV